MPQIRIDKNSAFSTHTGLLGGIDFKDGVSLYNVSLRDAHRLATMVRVTDAETGQSVDAVSHGISTRGLDTTEATVFVAEAEKPADAVAPEAPEALVVTVEAGMILAEVIDKPVEQPEKNERKFDFDRATLEALADKKGIQGLREFAEKFQVRSVSISGIIDGLLAKKDAAEVIQGAE